MNTLKRMAAVLVALMLLLGWSPAPQSAGGTVLILSAQAEESPSQAPVSDGNDPIVTNDDDLIAKLRKLGVGKTTTVTIKGVKYTLKKLNKYGDLKLITASSSSRKRAITVPSSIGDCDITQIGGKAFKSCKNVTKIDLPKTITTICKRAFFGSKVKTLTIRSKKLKKSSVKNAFKGSNIKTIKVPNNKKRAYNKIFAKTNSGKKVTIKGI